MDTKVKPVEIGDVVRVTDQFAGTHNALVVQAWRYGSLEENPTPSINVVYVSDDEKKMDQYGRQIERDLTSVPYKDQQSAPGRYWEWPS